MSVSLARLTGVPYARPQAADRLDELVREIADDFNTVGLTDPELLKEAQLILVRCFHDDEPRKALKRLVTGCMNGRERVVDDYLRRVA